MSDQQQRRVANASHEHFEIPSRIPFNSSEIETMASLREAADAGNLDLEAARTAMVGRGIFFVVNVLRIARDAGLRSSPLMWRAAAELSNGLQLAGSFLAVPNGHEFLRGGIDPIYVRGQHKSQRQIAAEVLAEFGEKAGQLIGTMCKELPRQTDLLLALATMATLRSLRDDDPRAANLMRRVEAGRRATPSPQDLLLISPSRSMPELERSQIINIVYNSAIETVNSGGYIDFKDWLNLVENESDIYHVATIMKYCDKLGYNNRFDLAIAAASSLCRISMHHDDNPQYIENYYDEEPKYITNKNLHVYRPDIAFFEDLRSLYIKNRPITATKIEEAYSRALRISENI